MLVFVMGAPGSGKGTLCRKLSMEFKYSHLSVGDHLREIVQTRSETLDQDTIDRIRSSELLDNNQLLPILQTAVRRLELEGAEVILVDGFPRQIEQVKVEGNFNLRPDLVLFFDCPREIAKERYLTRALAGRDNEIDVFKRRHGEFAQLNRLLVQEYDERGILITVDTSRDTDVSYKALLEVLRTADRGLC